jgi:hypothetical protein
MDIGIKKAAQYFFSKAGLTRQSFIDILIRLIEYVDPLHFF